MPPHSFSSSAELDISSHISRTYALVSCTKESASPVACAINDSLFTQLTAQEKSHACVNSKYLSPCQLRLAKSTRCSEVTVTCPHAITLFMAVEKANGSGQKPSFMAVYMSIRTLRLEKSDGFVFTVADTIFTAASAISPEWFISSVQWTVFIARDIKSNSCSPTDIL